MAPSGLLGILVDKSSAVGQIHSLTAAFLQTSSIASANYTINEFLENFVRHQPPKQKKALVGQDVSSHVIAFQKASLISKLVVLIRRWSAYLYQSPWLLELSKPRHKVISKKLKRSCYCNNCPLFHSVFGTWLVLLIFWFSNQILHFVWVGL